MTGRTEIEERDLLIAKVVLALAEHRYVQSSNRVTCSCGYEVGKHVRRDLRPNDHDAHQAEILHAAELLTTTPVGSVEDCG